MPTLPAARNRVFRRNQSIFMAPRMRFSRNALVSALTAPRNRHNGKLFRGDLAGRLAATLKNSLKKAAVRYRPLRFRKAGFLLAAEARHPAPADQLFDRLEK